MTKRVAPPSVVSLGERITTSLAKIGLAMRTEERAGVGEHGLSPTQGQILAILRARAAPMRLAQIADALAVKPPTASDSVRVLVEKGLVRKEAAIDDARAVAIQLTAQGARAAGRTAGWPDAMITAVSALDPAEQEVLHVALLKMIRELQESGRIPVARMCVDCTHFRAAVHDDAERPHHCALVDAALRAGELRIDCADHALAEPEARAASWARFSLRKPTAAR